MLHNKRGSRGCGWLCESDRVSGCVALPYFNFFVGYLHRGGLTEVSGGGTHLDSFTPTSPKGRLGGARKFTMGAQLEYSCWDIRT